jgi:hypothetical protein
METPRVNLNAASEHDLTQLPRIGTDTARRIVHHRATRKGFRDWADFAETLGMSDADVEAIKSRAWIGPRSDPPNTAAERRRAVRETIRARPPRSSRS